MKECRFQMGSEVRDVITGFTGFVTGHAGYITGCDQYLVQPTVNEAEKKFIEARWFDETRLAVTAAAPVVIAEAQHDNGPDLSAPVK